MGSSYYILRKFQSSGSLHFCAHADYSTCKNATILVSQLRQCMDNVFVTHTQYYDAACLLKAHEGKS